MPKKSFSKKAGEFAVNAIKLAAGLSFKAVVWIAKFLWRLLSRILSLSGNAVSSAVKKAGKPSARPVFSPLSQLKAFDGSAEDFGEWLYSGKSTVGIILGARGSGKSGLGMRLLENWAAKGRKVCAMGFDASSLPAWIHAVESVERAPNGSVLLVDEGGILFGSRDAMSSANKLLSRLLFVSRHKDLSIVFVSQNSANLEVNTIRQADYLLLKRPALLQKDFERNKIRDIYSDVAQDFKDLRQDKGLVCVYSDEFRGFASNSLPSFWTEKTGKAFGKARLS